ncbi:hypothetical protein THRCLA_10992 [Thraustotheca clavata]|uniref:DUF1697 domain-containing protein n=1 Tax=Thraustotheca clavata TaxID=74557 RepID=A0A1V9YBL1_9STRA|nr:hypothetical protein THRCLA_10992 [Thraustotheca clavata]
MSKRKSKSSSSASAKKSKLEPIPAYVAFLRAVNVGGRTVKMASIVEYFKALGFTNVSSFLASGNVIFHTSTENIGEIEQSIEKTLLDNVGFDIPVMVRSKTQLEQILTESSSQMPKGTTTTHVMFAKTSLSDEHQAIAEGWTIPSDIFSRVTNESLFWFSQTTMSKSPCFNKQFEKLLGVALTLRNINTIRRLLGKMV